MSSSLHTEEFACESTLVFAVLVQVVSASPLRLVSINDFGRSLTCDCVPEGESGILTIEVGIREIPGGTQLEVSAQGAAASSPSKAARELFLGVIEEVRHRISVGNHP